MFRACRVKDTSAGSGLAGRESETNIGGCMQVDPCMPLLVVVPVSEAVHELPFSRFLLASPESALLERLSESVCFSHDVETASVAVSPLFAQESSRSVSRSRLVRRSVCRPSRMFFTLTYSALCCCASRERRGVQTFPLQALPLLRCFVYARREERDFVRR